MKFYIDSTKRKFTHTHMRRLYESITRGCKDGYLSIAGAQPIAFFTADDLRYCNEYKIFVSPETESGKKKMFNAFVLERKSGQIIVIGRELPRKHALALATGKTVRR